MPKRLIKKYLPNSEKIKTTKGLGFLAKWLGNPKLWHIHRHNTSKAFAIGLFWMSIPIPFQMVTAAISAIIFKANLPISIALVWISNPLTMPVFFYFNYLIGTWVLGHYAVESIDFELSFHWIFNALGELWLPLYIGSFIVGTSLAIISHLTLRLIWRISVILKWQQRKGK